MEHGAGTTFGKYRILRKLGHGGMGAVYEAEHLHLHKRVALKVLHDSVAQKPGGTERFLREGRAAARLSHPNVVDVWDVGVEGGALYLVMELLSGEDLAARIARDKQLAVTDAVDLLLPVCAAVFTMHARGLVHRDLKPENIFLSRAPGAAVTPKVLDFGICRDDESQDPAALSTTGGLVGTPNYMAPEQVTGRRADARSDQHALAVILYECLCARRPYEGPTLLELLSNIADGRFVEPRALRAELPAALNDAIVRAMAPVPEQRFDSVRALGDALCPFASERGAQRWAECFDDAPSREPSASHAGAPTMDAADERLVTDVGAAPSAQTLSGSETPAPRSRRAQPRAVGAALAALAAVLGLAWIARAPSPSITRATALPVAPSIAPPRSAPSEPRPTEPTRPAQEPPRAALASAPDASARASTARALRPQTTRTQTATAATSAAPQTAAPPSSAAVTAPSRPTINGAPIVD